MSPKTLSEVKDDLIHGSSAKEVAKKYGIGLSSVYNIRAEMKEKDFAQSIVDTSRSHTGALEVVQKAIKANEHSMPVKDFKELTQTVDSLQSLKLLDVHFHKTITMALDRAEQLLEADNLSILEWQMITSTLSACHKDIFSTGNTVNNLVQGDIVGTKGSSLSMFQGRM